MGNCISKFCCLERQNLKPIIEIAKKHKEHQEVTMLYVPIINEDEAYI